MGLYINEEQNSIYKSGAKIDGNNQAVFIHNRTSEMVKEQARFNDAIESNLSSIKALYDHQHIESKRKWLEFEGRLNELEHFSKSQVAMEEELMHQLEKLEFEQKKTRKLMEEEQLREQERQENWYDLSSGHQEILQRLEAISKENDQLSGRVTKQLEIQEEMSQRLTNHDEKSDKLEKRLGEQEAFTEKISRQLDYFRSILFERTNYLAEKIDEATSFISRFIKKEDLSSIKIINRERQKQEK